MSVGGKKHQLICVCYSLCATCITHKLSMKPDWNCKTSIAQCSNVAEFVFDYRTRLRFWQGRPSREKQGRGALPAKLSDLLCFFFFLFYLKYLITTHRLLPPTKKLYFLFWGAGGAQTFFCFVLHNSQRWIEIGPSWCY